MSKAYVLLSGGIDSSTCLAMANKTFDGSVTGIIIEYGQRHIKEVFSARQVAGFFGLPVVVKNLARIIGVGGLTDSSLEVPQVSYKDLAKGISPTYVPFRNGLFLSVAASIAMADREAELIYYGAHAEDAENDAYPDCSVPFIEAIGEAVFIGTYGQIRLAAPLAKMTKKQVVLAGDNLGVPWHHTWSCYEGGMIHCGACPTCRSRRNAFFEANVIDPTGYAS
jgi:7-cyano-7-deazaguanine synthase